MLTECLTKTSRKFKFWAFLIKCWSPNKELEFQFFKKYLKIPFWDASTSAVRFMLRSKLPIYSWFMMANIAFPVRSWNFNYFKRMPLRYFFKVILLVLSDSCYDKNDRFAAVFWLANINFPLFQRSVRSWNFNFFKYIL